jgi:hypothetical protein
MIVGFHSMICLLLIIECALNHNLSSIIRTAGGKFFGLNNGFQGLNLAVCLLSVLLQSKESGVAGGTSQQTVLIDSERLAVFPFMSQSIRENC